MKQRSVVVRRIIHCVQVDEKNGVEMKVGELSKETEREIDRF